MSVNAIFRGKEFCWFTETGDGFNLEKCTFEFSGFQAFRVTTKVERWEIVAIASQFSDLKWKNKTKTKMASILSQ